MKIVVYAIAKNEAAFVDRWMDSMSEADAVVVLDTGSTDDTPARLRARGAFVEEARIVPWRFDTARNRSLALVPKDADICVCTDLDEVFHPGWRKILEAAWKPGTARASYRYTWSFTPEGKEGVVFWIEKIHARRGWRWTHPVHEVLSWAGPGEPGPTLPIPGIQIDHHPDPKKSRAQYLPLLELSVKEDPDDDRNLHYLGREYLYCGRYDDCIRTLLRHLSLPRATWADERAASMRFLAQAFLHKGDTEKAVSWWLRACAEAPHLREAAVELAQLFYTQENWDGVLYFTGRALRITQRPHTYICEASAWGSLPHDLRAIALSRTGRHAEALQAAKKALAYEPQNPRLRENVRLLAQMVSQANASDSAK